MFNTGLDVRAASAPIFTKVCALLFTAYSFASEKVAIPGDLFFNAINTTQTFYLGFCVIFCLYFSSIQLLKSPILNVSGPILEGVLVSRTEVPEIVFILRK